MSHTILEALHYVTLARHKSTLQDVRWPTITVMTRDHAEFLVVGHCADGTADVIRKFIALDAADNYAWFLAASTAL